MVTGLQQPTRATWHVHKSLSAPLGFPSLDRLPSILAADLGRGFPGHAEELSLSFADARRAPGRAFLSPTPSCPSPRDYVEGLPAVME